MKKEWTRPQLSIDNFELSQHIAAQCKDEDQKQVVIKAVFDCGSDRNCSHSWTIPDVYAFDSTETGCTVIWTTEAEMVAWAKDWISKNAASGDWHSWGDVDKQNPQHDAIINGMTFETLFAS